MKILSCLLLTTCVGFSAQSLADDVDHPPQMSKKEQMTSCMKKQMADDNKMSQADMKKHCKDTIDKSKESTGPVSGTTDPTKP